MTLNPDRLSKHYDKLTPRERFSLILAAGVRGDEAEQDRLQSSAPEHLFCVPDYRGYSEGFNEVASLYPDPTTGNGGGGCWKCLATFEGARKTSQRLLNCLGLFGHQFVTRRQAWQRLCEEYGIDGNAVLSVYPGYAMIQHLDEMIPALACTREQAAVILREHDESLSPACPEETYKAMRRSFEERAAWWA